MIIFPGGSIPTVFSEMVAFMALRLKFNETIPDF